MREQNVDRVGRVIYLVYKLYSKRVLDSYFVLDDQGVIIL
jgi:hypothetical protein